MILHVLLDAEDDAIIGVFQDLDLARRVASREWLDRGYRMDLLWTEETDSTIGTSGRLHIAKPEEFNVSHQVYRVEEWEMR